MVAETDTNIDKTEKEHYIEYGQKPPIKAMKSETVSSTKKAEEHYAVEVKESQRGQSSLINKCEIKGNMSEVVGENTCLGENVVFFSDIVGMIEGNMNEVVGENTCMGVNVVFFSDMLESKSHFGEGKIMHLVKGECKPCDTSHGGWSDFNKPKKKDWHDRMRAKRTNEADYRVKKVGEKSGANKKEPCCFRDQNWVRCGVWVERNSGYACSVATCHHHCCINHRWYGHGPRIAANRVCVHCIEVSESDSENTQLPAKPCGCAAHSDSRERESMESKAKLIENGDNTSYGWRPCLKICQICEVARCFLQSGHESSNGHVHVCLACTRYPGIGTKATIEGHEFEKFKEDTRENANEFFFNDMSKKVSKVGEQIWTVMQDTITKTVGRARWIADNWNHFMHMINGNTSISKKVQQRVRQQRAILDTRVASLTLKCLKVDTEEDTAKRLAQDKKFFNKIVKLVDSGKNEDEKSAK